MKRKLLINTLVSLITTLLLNQKIKAQELKGRATYYASKFVGRRTATGEIFSHKSMTAASNSFKLGSLVKVTNLFNGNSVVVRINDRMAKKSERKGRIVDLTLKAFSILDDRTKSLIRVNVQLL